MQLDLREVSAARGGEDRVAEWTPDARLQRVEARLAARGFRVRRGGGFDAWDLEIRNGLFGASRLLMAVEDHGAGAQLVRARAWPSHLLRGLVLAALSLALSLAAMLDQLERCQKALADFLEQKRSAMPRFYFIGDDDLLEILGQAKNPTVIQVRVCTLAVRTWCEAAFVFTTFVLA